MPGADVGRTCPDDLLIMQHILQVLPAKGVLLCRGFLRLGAGLQQRNQGDTESQ